MPHLQVEKRFAILPKETGTYHAFPTLIRQNDRLWMACRSGKVDPCQTHGTCGQVRLLAAHRAAADRWTLHGILFKPTPGGTENELDAILSAPEPDLFFLATRDYAFNRRNDVYLSRGRSPVLHRRSLLTAVSDNYAICFGHIRRASNGDLLMPGYCGFDEEPQGTPVLLVSSDRGETWTLRTKVASSTAVKTRLTEYSLGHVAGKRWIALIRNEASPFNLYRVNSEDDGRAWSIPEKTSLCGHAPMLLDDESLGGHLVIYRDLSEPEPGVAVGLSLDQGISWERLARLSAYQGSIFDGGYGDLVRLERNRYLAVYYLCDGDSSPWIEGCLFSIR